MKSKKNKILKICLLILLVPILLIGVGYLYVQSNQSAIIKGEITKLNAEHKGLISVGDSELSILGNFPYISIKVYDVKILESKKEDASIIMDVEDLYIGFNIWDIIEGNYDIQSLFIEEGICNFIIHENNTTNIQNSLESTTDGESASTNIHLKRIKLKNIDVHTLDEATNTDVETYIYTGEGGFSQKDTIIAGHIDTDFELNVIKNGDTTFIHKKHFEVHTGVTFNEITGMLTIAPSGIVMENGDFELEGTIDTYNDVDLNLSIEGTKPNFDMLIAFAPVDVIPVLEKYKNAGEIYFNATIKGPSNLGNRPHILANFGAGKAFLENTKHKRRIDNMGFEGYFTNGEKRNASTMEFSLKNMTASMEKGEFKGSVFVRNFNSPEVDMRIDSNFNLGFVLDFLELEQVQDASGEVSLKMNFHDVIDIEYPERALQKLNQSYFTELIVKDLGFSAKELPAPLEHLNAHMIMNGKEANLKQLELKMGNSDLSITGFLSDLPAVVHHTSIPVEAHLDIQSNYLDLAQLTAFNALDSIPKGMDEQIKNLSLGLSLKSSAKDITASKYLPKGEFFIDSLHADLKHYPHELHDFHADVLIDDRDLKIIDFTGYIDDSDFHLNGLAHDYAFWMQPELRGEVDLDINLSAKQLRLEDVFSYKGENYVPEEYRHEVFNDLAIHVNSSMFYKDSTLHAIDVALDKLDTKMKVHPLRFHDFKGNFHYEDDHIVINDFHGEIGKTNFNIIFNYYLGQNEEIKKRDNYLEVSANYIDYDALFNFEFAPVKTEEQQVISKEDVKKHADAFNLYELPFTDMQFKAAIGHFIYHRIDLQNIIADLRTTPNHYIYVDTLNMDAAGGNIRLNGYFNGSDPKHIYMKPDLKMDNVDLDKLLFKFENFGQDHLVSENLEGKLSTSINGKIRVYPDLVPDLDQSTLEMEVKVLDGKLKNYDPMLALSDYMGDKNLKNIRFDTLQNHLDINKGKITIPNMRIESTLGHIELSGTHDSNQNIDYYLQVPWKMIRKAAWQKVFKKKNDSLVDANQEDEIISVDPKKKQKYLNIKIKGNTEDYKISLGKKKRR